LRAEAGLTQEALGIAAGVPLDTLRSIEQGRTRNPGVMLVVRIANALNVSLDELVRGPEYPSVPSDVAPPPDS